MTCCYYPHFTTSENTGIFSDGYIDNQYKVITNNRAVNNDLVYYVFNEDKTVDIVGIKKRSNEYHVGILELNNPKLYGKNKKGVKLFKVSTLSYETDFLVSFKKYYNYHHNLYVAITFKEWNTNQKKPRGQISIIIGSLKDDEAEDMALLYKNGLYFRNHKDIEYKTVPKDQQAEYDDVIVIDPAGSLDLDDGFSVDDENIYVHISNPCYYIGNNYDKELRLRISSIYGYKTYHMLPEIISCQIASLNKNGVKAVITVIFDHQFNFKSLKQTFIKVRHQISYEEAQYIYDNKETDEITKALKVINSCYVVNAANDVHDVHDVHEIIANLMVKTNSTIAKYLFDHDIHFYRYHEKSQLLVPKHIKTKYEKGAYYSNDSTKTSHHGLDIKYYTHFTSPLRRFADLLVHDAIINGKQICYQDIDAINRYTRKLKKYYRDRDIIIFYRKIREGGLYQNIKGYITSKKDNGIITIYFPYYDIEIKYPEFSHLDLFQAYWFNVIIIDHEIKLNKKIVLELVL
jgi:exoribonuclease R